MAGELCPLFAVLFGILPALVFAGVVFLFVGLPIVLWIFRIVYQYEKGVIFSFGQYSRTAEPGLTFLIPIMETMRKVDMRITTIDIPRQEVMTKDNVPAGIDAVVYFRVTRPEDAVLKLEDYIYAVAKYAQTALRDVIGNQTLDTVLTEREQIASLIEAMVDKETSQWGIDVTAIKLQDISLPPDMKRAMARQAEAERDKRATIIKSEGEMLASKNLNDAAVKLATAPGAMHLRSLQTLTEVGAVEGNNMIFFVPLEVLGAMEGIGSKQLKDGIAKKKEKDEFSR